MVPPVVSGPGLTDGAGVAVLRAAGASGVVPLLPRLPYAHESLRCERDDSDNDRGKEGGIFVVATFHPHEFIQGLPYGGFYFYFLPALPSFFFTLFPSSHSAESLKESARRQRRMFLSH